MFLEKVVGNQDRWVGKKKIIEIKSSSKSEDTGQKAGTNTCQAQVTIPSGSCCDPGLQVELVGLEIERKVGVQVSKHLDSCTSMWAAVPGQGPGPLKTCKEPVGTSLPQLLKVFHVHCLPSSFSM